MTPFFRRAITHTLLAVILLTGVQSAPNRRDDNATSNTSPTSASPTSSSSDTSISSASASSTAAFALPTKYIPCAQLSDPVPDDIDSLSPGLRCSNFVDSQSDWSTSDQEAFNLETFIALNPDVGPDCTNLTIGQIYCLLPLTDPNQMPQTAVPMTDTPLAGNLAVGGHCGRWEYPWPQQNCVDFAKRFSLTLFGLQTMNLPEYTDNCRAWSEHFGNARYCVQAILGADVVDPYFFQSDENLSTFVSSVSASIAAAATSAAAPAASITAAVAATGR
ncbi:hypothetical protein DFH06DRAFT_180534 [Mycena polygramma]|nr:hypothetical protein DFH06DRAFT_180534 [Mycena polygramma]